MKLRIEFAKLLSNFCHHQTEIILIVGNVICPFILNISDCSEKNALLCFPCVLFVGDATWIKLK